MDALYAENEELISKMKQILPIKALPRRELVSSIRNANPRLTLKSKFLIKNVLNSGDTGGIVCEIESEDLEQEKLLICSLTHVEIDLSVPLRMDILKYQVKRAKRLEKQNKQAWN